MTWMMLVVVGSIRNAAPLPRRGHDVIILRRRRRWRSGRVCRRRRKRSRFFVTLLLMKSACGGSRRRRRRRRRLAGFGGIIVHLWTDRRMSVRVRLIVAFVVHMGATLTRRPFDVMNRLENCFQAAAHFVRMARFVHGGVGGR